MSADGESIATTATVGRPTWLGTRILPRRADGFGEVRPTPPELRDRRLPSPDLLPAPHGDEFVADVQAVPQEVVRRSTWSPRCPVALQDLRYLTLTFWGFDERPHTGELLVHTSVAEDVVGVFRRLYAARFPIEEMRVVSAGELTAPATGDGNNTTSYVCRPITGGSSWSEHAYGLAIDINPFHNPYLRGDLVVPELASAYTNRNWQRPGMVRPGDEATKSFAEIGWSWGGNWRRPKDWMHFSRKGR
ncbi:MAG: M15 family metallopeptidase [Actinomycetota bacterium]|nr:M15 family metallopeptidase [Actinomycetota bacterium]